MGFSKKVLVLKQVDLSTDGRRLASGIARIEVESGVAELHLSFINIPYLSGDYYSAFVFTDKFELFQFSLGAHPTLSAFSLPKPIDLEKGICVGLCAIKDKIPLCTLFATTDEKSLNISAFKRAVAEKCLAEFKKASIETVPFPPQPTPNVAQDNPPAFDKYNDEAVATENYYALDKQIEQKLKLIKGCDHEDFSTENELLADFSQEKTQKKCEDTCCAQNETAFCQSGEHKERYYFSVKDELSRLFLRFPEEQALCRLFPDSRWAKINYADDKFYVVGLIKEDDKEKYICYGVPAVYSQDPPKALKGFCSFIPLSLFDMKGKGYWMMFQDADDGKCIRI